MANILSPASYYKIDGQLAEIKHQMRQENGYPYTEAQLIQHLQDAIEGRFLEREVPHVLMPLYSFKIEAVESHRVQDCFRGRGGIQYRRNGDLDHWKPQLRRAHAGGSYQASAFTYNATYREVIQAILEVGVEASDTEIHCRLKEGGHCVEMLQIEHLIERLEAGERNTGLARDEKTTLFFVDNQDGRISAVRVFKSSCGRGTYFVRISRLNLGSRWPAGSRVVYLHMQTGLPAYPAYASRNQKNSFL